MFKITLTSNYYNYSILLLIIVLLTCLIYKINSMFAVIENKHGFFFIIPSYWCKVISHCNFNLCLLLSDVERPIIHLLAMCGFSFLKNLFGSFA